MARSLRSNSRLKKLQVKHIQQVDKAFRLLIGNCKETNMDNFDQQEFLSLFGLIPIKEEQQNIIKISKLMLEQQQTIIEEMTKINDIAIDKMTLENRRQDNDAMSKNNNNDHQFNGRSTTLDNRIADAISVQNTLVTRRQNLLREILDAFADARKYHYFYELDKQRNIILKIKINELHNKLMFLLQITK